MVKNLGRVFNLCYRELNYSLKRSFYKIGLTQLVEVNNADLTNKLSRHPE